MILDLFRLKARADGPVKHHGRETIRQRSRKAAPAGRRSLSSRSLPPRRHFCARRRAAIDALAKNPARRVAPPGAATARAAGLHRHPPAEQEARLMARSLSRTNAVVAAAMAAAPTTAPPCRPGPAQPAGPAGRPGPRLTGTAPEKPRPAPHPPPTPPTPPTP